MALRIGTNIAAISASRNLSRTNEDMQRSLTRLGSGSRIVQPGDDAAGFAISEQLRGQVSSLGQARRNADNAIGLVQVAEGGLLEQNNIAVRLREIAVQSASDTVSDTERGYLDTEFQMLVEESDRIARSTRFGKKPLLTGSGESFEFFVGTSGDSKSDIINYKLKADTTSSSLGIAGMSVADQDDAQDVLGELDETLVKLADARAGFGSIQERLQIAGNNLDVQKQNVEEARSRIADVDVAEESTQLARTQVLQEMGIAVLAQANQSAGRVLKLL